MILDTKTSDQASQRVCVFVCFNWLLFRRDIYMCFPLAVVTFSARIAFIVYTLYTVTKYLRLDLSMHTKSFRVSFFCSTWGVSSTALF